MESERGEVKPLSEAATGGTKRLLLATRDLRGVGVDQQRLSVAGDGALVDHDLVDVGERREVEHDVEERALDDRAQAARAGAALERALGDRRQRMFAELE